MSKILVIPDLHGNFFKLLELLQKFITIDGDLITHTDYRLIFLGDLVDKGNPKEQILLIEFIHKNLEKIELVLGNHDYKNKKKLLDQTYILGKNYDFYDLIKDDTLLVKKFLDITNKMVRYIETDYHIFTHSPYLTEHLKKKNGNLTQYTFKRPKEIQCKIEYFNYVKAFFKEVVEDNQYHKVHIFGHLEMKKPIINNNQIWLDTTGDLHLLEIDINNEFIFHNKLGVTTAVQNEKNILDFVLSSLFDKT